MIHLLRPPAFAGLLALAMPTAVAAQPPQAVAPDFNEASLAAAVSREAIRAAATPTFRTSHRGQAPAVQARRSFVKRRPVLSGLLMGAAAGTAIAASAWGNEGAFVGFYGGAAAGATTGWLLSR